MRPPEGFMRTLSMLDPLLSIRWGEHVGQWVVERKAVTPVHELKWLLRRRAREEARVKRGEAAQTDLRGLNEEILALQSGKRVICFAKSLTTELYNNLCLSDITSYGGFSRYAAEVEREEAELREKQNKAATAYFSDLADEMFGKGNGETSPYDFLMSKKRIGALQELQRGSKTLHELLGVPNGQPLYGRGA